MNQLIPITKTPDDATAVMGRDLYAFLEVRRDYTTWFKQMCSYGFKEGTDYILTETKTAGQPGSPNLVNRKHNHVIGLDMAKQIAMLQRTPRGRQAREYFIEVEKQWRAGTPPTPARLSREEILQMALDAERERKALEAANRELEPKAAAYDSFIDATGYYSMGAVAKMLGKGRQWLFRELQNRGVLIPKGKMKNTPYQKYMHHFVVKAGKYEYGNGESGTGYTTYVQPSGIDFIRKKLGLTSIDPLPL